MRRFATSALPAAGAALLVLLVGLTAGPVRAADGDEDQPATPPANPAAPPLAGGGASAQELANQIANPAAPVTSLQLRNIVTPWIEGTSGAADVFQFQPVIPIGPFDWLPVVQIVKITMPIVASVPEPPGRRGRAT